jgi:hypothetical protein
MAYSSFVSIQLSARCIPLRPRTTPSTPSKLFYFPVLLNRIVSIILCSFSSFNAGNSCDHSAKNLLSSFLSKTLTIYKTIILPVGSETWSVSLKEKVDCVWEQETEENIFFLRERK